MVTLWAGDNPDPVDTIGARDYEHHGDDRPDWLIGLHLARGLDKVLFVGEFGMRGESFSDEERERFHEQLDRIERHVPLAALWVYDLHHQVGEWSITADNARAWQLEAIAEANQRLRDRQP